MNLPMDTWGITMIVTLVVCFAFLLIALVVLGYLHFSGKMDKYYSCSDPEGEEWDYYWNLLEEGQITQEQFNLKAQFILMRRAVRGGMF